MEIHGYKSLIPNQFLGNNTASEHLGIVFPGRGYTAQMPVLYYPTRVLTSLGADVLLVNYNYPNQEFLSLSDSQRLQWVEADALATFEAALQLKPYRQITLVGKSIGTLALERLLAKHPTSRTAQFVWLTPLLIQEGFKETIARYPHRALFVIGSRDPSYDPALLEQIRASTNGTALVIDGADHSLELGGDIRAAIRAQERIAMALEGFLTRVD